MRALVAKALPRSCAWPSVCRFGLPCDSEESSAILTAPGIPRDKALGAVRPTWTAQPQASPPRGGSLA
jgi:hypothetical protein